MAIAMIISLNSCRKYSDEDMGPCNTCATESQNNYPPDNTGCTTCGGNTGGQPDCNTYPWQQVGPAYNKFAYVWYANWVNGNQMYIDTTDDNQPIANAIADISSDPAGINSYVSFHFQNEPNSALYCSVNISNYAKASPCGGTMRKIIFSMWRRPINGENPASMKWY